MIAKQATTSFVAEVVPPACWIILYLSYINFYCTVNEEGPELPCMKGFSFVLLFIYNKKYNNNNNNNQNTNYKYSKL